jgi:hypothetical protein
MSKTLLSLFVAVCSLNAATIMTQATCPGIGVLSGTTSVQCPPPYAASAGIVANAVYQDSVSISANSHGAAPHHGDGSFASATFIDDYVLTVTGGTGSGIFAPCLFAGAVYIGTQTMGSASFGSVSFSGYRVANCGFQGAPQPPTMFLPFTFDIPQTFAISLYSSTDEGSGRASLDSFQFFDTHINPLNNVHFSLVSGDLPEPSSWSMLAVGAIFLLAVAMIGRVAGAKE